MGNLINLAEVREKEKEWIEYGLRVTKSMELNEELFDKSIALFMKGFDFKTFSNETLWGLLHILMEFFNNKALLNRIDEIQFEHMADLIAESLNFVMKRFGRSEQIVKFHTTKLQMDGNVYNKFSKELKGSKGG